jgi:methionine synthase II (cobalamin-independent)
LFLVPGEKPMPPVTVRVVARGPVRSKGPEAINRQLDSFKAAIERSGAEVDEAFVPVLAPGWLDHFIFNEYYRTVEAYRQFARRRIDAVNHALAGIPEERVRYHLCWGSWHGPHTHDLPLEHIIDLILEVKAQTYSFEAANVRHEHEWRVWQNAKLPPGKMLMPGVVSHATNLVEHPQLVADRALRYAAIVGRENVIAGTDCGLGGRVHGDLAWAKLRVLAEGARLASKSLWP